MTKYEEAVNSLAILEAFDHKRGIGHILVQTCVAKTKTHYESVASFQVEFLVYGRENEDVSRMAESVGAIAEGIMKDARPRLLDAIRADLKQEVVGLCRAAKFEAATIDKRIKEADKEEAGEGV